jgi:rod shape-determining protein MreC
MAFASGGINTSSGRETAPGGRFFICAVLSLVLMYFDQRDGWSERIRYVLQAVAYPIQVTVGSPGRLASATREFFRSRNSLRAQNSDLEAKVRELSLRTERYEALLQENAQLRGLTSSLPPLVSKSLLADVVDADLGRLRQRLVINQGEREGLFRSQSVVDTSGLVGQLVRVGPWSAEVMLITDPEAAVPVEILRSGERTIAVGTGDSRELQLPYLPATADVKAGDEIVTSGLGGVFPAGIPVGKITENTRDPDDLLAHVRATPSAQLDRTRHVLALWFDPSNPAAPRRPEMLNTLPPASVTDPVTHEPAPPKQASKPAAAAGTETPAPKPPPRRVPFGPRAGFTRPAAPETDHSQPVPTPAPPSQPAQPVPVQPETVQPETAQPVPARPETAQ